MSRRLLLAILVPALVGAMVGVGAAAWRPDAVRKAVATEAATPPAQPQPTPFEVAFSREPSGLRKTELPAAKRKKHKPDKDKAPSYDVAEVQQQLTDLKYYVGPIDGEAGGGTASALMAFQKVQGIAADGAIGEQTLAALAAPKKPSLRGGPATRIEVDLTKQVLFYVEGGALTRILPVSSGSGSTYTTASGGTARSLTPVGSYAVQRKISGVREAPLGSLYDPMYFYQGWAIHGSNSVPAYPASHGCIRVTRADALWLFPRVPVGFPLVIYGGTHTFTAGSDAPGTSDPAGDVDTAEPSEAPEPEPDREPEPDPKPKPKPEPQPEPTTPAPSESPAPKPTGKPKPSPSEEAPATAVPTPPGD